MYDHLFLKKNFEKKYKKSPHQVPSQAEREEVPLPQTGPEVIHLLEREAQTSPQAFYATLHRLHKTIGNQKVAQLFRQAQEISLSPEEEASQAFQHATSVGARQIPYQSEMESSFGVSFGKVNAYFGAKSTQGMDALGAEAAAFGNKVAFRTSTPSKSTVAHELTHVVQQGGHLGSTSIPSAVGVSNPSDAAEVEADEIGKNF